jgi:5'-AMP-activated protein kinase catalytic alpha subunit
MIKGERYDGLMVDIWSSGVILFAMLCGYLPFEDQDTPALYRKILSGNYSLYKSISE